MEKRSESRVESDIRFFIHIHECEANPELVGNSITCSGVDFSAHGLQLKTETILPAGTILHVTIGIGEPFAMYLLAGTVRWARETKEGTFMGVLLKDQPDTDFNEWVSRFTRLFHPN